MITRMQMPRQLRNKGGIMTIGGGGYTGKPMGSRTGFGFIDKITDRFRKLIPNELASVAVKAAPFVAPFNPGIAGLMRGIGRFDQRGSISDALKQGFATAAFGKLAGEIPGTEKYFGKGMEGAKALAGDVRTKAGSLFQGKTPGVDSNVPKTPSTEGTGFMKKATEATIDKIPFADKLPQKVKEKLLAGTISSGASALYSYFAGEFDEPQQPGETMGEYMARRNARVKQQVRAYMDSYYTPLRNPEYASLTPEQRDNFIDGIVGQTELEGTTDYGYATGGRVGYQTGGITMANTLAENIRRNLANQAAFQQAITPTRERVKEQIRKRTPVQEYAMGEDSILGPLSKKAASTIIEGQDKSRAALDLLNKTSMEPSGIMTQTPTADTAQIPGTMNSLVNVNKQPTSNNLLSLFERYKDIQTPVPADPESGFVGETALGNIEQGIKNFLKSDVGLRYKPDIESDIGDIYKFIEERRKLNPDLYGGDMYEFLTEFYRDKFGLQPLFMAKGGMPVGIMRTNKAGVMERDYRDKGGFVPVGIKEKADDVPAMLSKNEFVFTADAVRGAGNGSIEKGAQKMYNTMKNLEKRVV